MNSLLSGYLRATLSRSSLAGSSVSLTVLTIVPAKAHYGPARFVHGLIPLRSAPCARRLLASIERQSNRAQGALLQVSPPS